MIFDRHVSTHLKFTDKTLSTQRPVKIRGIVFVREFWRCWRHCERLASAKTPTIGKTSLIVSHRIIEVLRINWHVNLVVVISLNVIGKLDVKGLEFNLNLNFESQLLIAFSSRRQFSFFNPLFCFVDEFRFEFQCFKVQQRLT